MARRKTILVCAGVAVALATGGAVAVQMSSGEPAAAASTASVPHDTATAENRTLTRTTKKTGGLGYGESWTEGPRAEGTLTWLPEVGSVVDRGQPLARVDDKPVVALLGSLPLYRELSIGAKGNDVRQLEENLAALGYGGFVVDDKFDARTAKAVKAWQKDLGIEQTGRVSSDWVEVLPGPVRVDSHKARVGDPASGEALGVTGTEHLATVSLKASERHMAVEGAPVTVRLPGNVEAPGTITRVGPPVTPEADDSAPGGDSDTEAKSEVTVRVDDPAALQGLEVTPVEVVFTTEERVDVLTVPVKALVAMSGGGYGVEVPDGAGTRLVPVETGLFDGGYVEVTPQDDGSLSAGDTVVVPA